MKIISKMALASLLSINLFALEMNQTPKSVTIDGENGGLVKGGAWDSSTLNGKVNVVFYADPDEKDLNQEFTEKLKSMKFPLDRYQPTAIINMAATWLPNFAIEKMLESKQKKYPRTIYVKDKASVLVNEWRLKDHDYNVVVLNRAGKVIYNKSGKLDAQAQNELIELLKKEVYK